ncbi:uncharacterized protein [Haliotis cracherodii]|uniref:uncharacterized protein n=1 Tax=Haliotis cracherodii TaxID=6455 RepID=UPI0039E7AB7B
MAVLRPQAMVVAFYPGATPEGGTFSGITPGIRVSGTGTRHLNLGVQGSGTGYLNLGVQGSGIGYLNLGVQGSGTGYLTGNLLLTIHAQPKKCDSQLHPSKDLAALKIHISQATRDRLMKTDNYLISERGEIDIKGKGKMKTFWLDGRVDMSQANDSMVCKFVPKRKRKVKKDDATSGTLSLSTGVISEAGSTTTVDSSSDLVSRVEVTADVVTGRLQDIKESGKEEKHIRDVHTSNLKQALPVEDMNVSPADKHTRDVHTSYLKQALPVEDINVSSADKHVLDVHTSYLKQALLVEDMNVSPAGIPGRGTDGRGEAGDGLEKTHHQDGEAYKRSYIQDGLTADGDKNDINFGAEQNSSTFGRNITGSTHGIDTSDSKHGNDNTSSDFGVAQSGSTAGGSKNKDGHSEVPSIQEDVTDDKATSVISMSSGKGLVNEFGKRNIPNPVVLLKDEAPGSDVDHTVVLPNQVMTENGSIVDTDGTHMTRYSSTVISQARLKGQGHVQKTQSDIVITVTSDG